MFPRAERILEIMYVLTWFDEPAVVDPQAHDLGLHLQLYYHLLTGFYRHAGESGQLDLGGRK